MKTPEEIKQLAIECGMIDYKLGFDTTDQSLQSFYQLAYEEGRKVQRESDINICRQHYSIEGMAQNCAIDIADNTGD